MMEIRVFVTNLGMYNEGKLHGDWLTLPADEDEITTFLEEKVGINEQYEEWFLTDWESDIPGLCEAIKVGEYTNIFELSERLEDMPEIDNEAALELFSFDEAVEKVSNGDYTVYENCYSMTDVAYKVVEEMGLLDNTSVYVSRYFDYEMFGRDLDIEGHYVNCGNCYYEFFD